MLRIPAVTLVVVVVLASCGRTPKVDTPAPDDRPLAAYAAQRIAVTPVGIVRTDSLGWIRQSGDAVAAARRLDTAIANVLSDRGLASRWVLPDELARAYERNRSYATDPYRLALDQLRASTFVAASRFGEPLSTQLRTMIALHDATRYVLLPVELRFEGVGVGGGGGGGGGSSAVGRGVLRVALLDPRFAEARWVGELKGDTSSVPGRAIASVAARVGDLFTAP